MRVIGLEPTRRKTPDPKSGASTNFATRAESVLEIGKEAFSDCTEHSHLCLNTLLTLALFFSLLHNLSS